MKIVCDACQAKYSISDDKVQGKVFKIRCKKCSNIIVVRGGANAADATAAPAPEPAARVYDYNQGGDQAPADDEAVWHVVINQDQVGPMTPAEVQQRFAAGEIDAETYTWREGFADWLPLAQVDVFAEFVASGSTTSAAAHGHGGGAAAVSSMFGGGGGDEAGTVRSDPGDLFATAGKAAASSSADDDNDLFGSKPSAAVKDSAASAASKLRGERNENSVLFSLNNLAQLASDKPAPKASASSTPGAAPTGHATGAAGGEGSGLIDIRSMANAYLGGGGAGMAKPAAASSIGSIDDLPVFGGGGFSEPAVLVPVANRGGGGNNKMMLALIGSVGVLAVAAVILVVVMLKGGGDKDNKVAANDADKVAAKAAEGDTKAGDEDKPKVEGDKPATPDSAGTDTKPAEGDKPVDTKPAEGDKPSTTKPSTTKPSDKPATTSSGSRDTRPATTKPAETKPAEQAASGGCDEVNCVLNNYEGTCCAKYKKAKAGGTAAKPAAGGGAAESLDRTMISDGVNKVKARVMACGDKSPAKGQVKVSVKVGPSGSVESVTVKNTPDAALGNCVAAAMQKASFAKTANGGSFGYPFVF